MSWLIIVENILFSSTCMIHRFRCCINNNDPPAVILSIGIMSNFLFEYLSVSLWHTLLVKDFSRVMLHQVVQDQIGDIVLKKHNQQLLLMVSLYWHWLCSICLYIPEKTTKGIGYHLYLTTTDKNNMLFSQTISQENCGFITFFIKTSKREKKGDMLFI
jgi:hypothetical protein